MRPNNEVMSNYLGDFYGSSFNALFGVSEMTTKQLIGNLRLDAIYLRGQGEPVLANRADAAADRLKSILDEWTIFFNGGAYKGQWALMNFVVTGDDPDMPLNYMPLRKHKRKVKP